MIGETNPLPFQIGGGPSDYEATCLAFKRMLGEGATSDDDESIEAAWRNSRMLGVYALQSVDERAALQAFPQKATDNLTMFEEILAVEVDSTKSFEQRRQVVVPRYIESPDAWDSAVSAALTKLDPRLSIIRLLEHQSTTTYVGREFAAEPEIAGQEYAIGATAFPNYSDLHKVTVLFDISGLPTNSTLNLLENVKLYLNDVLPSNVSFSMIQSVGFFLDSSPLDITGFAQ